MSVNKTVIAVCGPTAAGKTDLAIQLALKYKTCIISADSRQCFRELNIGVAKPSEEELKTVKHYFIDSHSIKEDVNAGTFEKIALEAAGEIFSQNDFLVLAGGTGLYVKAFLEGFDNIPPVNQDIENNIRVNYISRGMDWLQEELKIHDPIYFAKGEMLNPQRMMRALGVMLSTGRSILDFHSSEKKERDFGVRKIFLNPPRKELYHRINERVDRMVAAGLKEEVQRLIPFKNLNALQTVGYSELFNFFDQKISFEEAVDLIKRNTRRYAKRQLTWFNKYFVDASTEVIGEETSGIS